MANPNNAVAEMRIEMISLSEVQRWPRNPKLHDHDAIAMSIRKVGYVDPLIVDEKSGKLVAGHGRLETLTAMKENGEAPPKRIAISKSGDWLVPVIRGVEFENEKDAENYLVASNRLVELGGWDEAILGDILKSLDEPIGWSPEDITGLLSDIERSQASVRPPGEFKEFDEGSKKTHECARCGFVVTCYDTTKG